MKDENGSRSSSRASRAAKCARASPPTSPTGYMHVGNLRTALLYISHRPARPRQVHIAHRGHRPGRLVEGAVDVIYRTLAECGLSHDEGPDVGGPVGPMSRPSAAGSTWSSPSG